MFWAGEKLTAYEAACMSSFVKRGCTLSVYSYGHIENLPPGVSLRPAQEIVDERFVDAFLIKGVPSLSHFSDLFRYRLFRDTEFVYADTDLYLLRQLDFNLPQTLLAREDENAICGAIMRLSAADPALESLIEHTERIAGRNLAWGETGPRLLTRVFGGDVITKQSFPPEVFFPIHYGVFWKVFLPEHYEECEALCRNAYTCHLWNNIVAKVGIWKDVLPPVGSYLERRFVEDGMGDFFHGTFPVDAMRNVITNYRMRLSGDFKDVKRILQYAAPGAKRRATRSLNRLRDQWALRLHVRGAQSRTP